jgi:hypothetical protein
MKPVKQIPGTVTEVDLATGKEMHKASAFDMLPPPADMCQICGVDHLPEYPHNAQSLHYQMIFSGMVGRSPTWADAMAHCDAKTRRTWEAHLRDLDAWSEPPDGEAPIKHHGI